MNLRNILRSPSDIELLKLLHVKSYKLRVSGHGERLVGVGIMCIDNLQILSDYHLPVYVEFRLGLSYFSFEHNP